MEPFIHIHISCPTTKPRSLLTWVSSVTLPAVACGIWGVLLSFSHVLKLLFTWAISNPGAESGHHCCLPGPLPLFLDSFMAWQGNKGHPGGLVSAARLSCRGSPFSGPQKHHLHQQAERDAGGGSECPFMLSAMGQCLCLCCSLPWFHTRAKLFP